MAATPPALRLYRAATRAAPWLVEQLARAAHRRQGADPARAEERRGHYPVARPEGRLVWIHAASLGEVAGVAPLALRLAEVTGARLLLTTFTAAGAQAVALHLGGRAIHAFLPADSPRAVARALDHWRPDVVIVAESDLWPNLLDAVAARGVPAVLVNARPSRSRSRRPALAAAMLAPFALVLTADPAVAEEIAAILPDPSRVRRVADDKAQAPPLPADPAALAAAQAAVAGRPVWVAASTHAGDEAAVAAAQAQAAAQVPGLLLIWVPRHPAARAEAIAARLPAPPPRRSAGALPGPGDAVWLFDTLGETGIAFRLAPVVFLGGSFGDEGGHNPLEPARLGCAVLSGPGIANHTAAFARLEGAGGARIVRDAAALAQAVVGLITTPAGAAAGRAAAAAAAGSSSAPGAETLIAPLLGAAP